MFFRFGAALVLIVVVSLSGIAVEKRILALKRSITLQQYRTEQLVEHHARLRLQVARLSAPGRLMDTLAEEESPIQSPQSPFATEERQAATPQ